MDELLKGRASVGALDANGRPPLALAAQQSHWQVAERVARGVTTVLTPKPNFTFGLPLLDRYVPAIARFLRERPVPLIHVRYEELVADPERHAQEIAAHLGLPYEPAMVDYGEAAQGAAARGLGDPVQAAKASRPTTDSLDKWKAALAADTSKLDAARASLSRVLDADLETWGYRRADLAAELDAISPRPGPSRKLDRFALERRVLGRLRKNIHHNALGRVVRRIRFICDVLLR